VAVAYSGGRDSTALLHATLAASARAGIAVVALHVHHGLQPAADQWLAHCRATCRRWAARPGVQLRFASTRLEGAPAGGDSVEAWARRERYRALRTLALAEGADLVLLAHHRRDQAETFLLQALRGAGVAGLAAMPSRVRREGITWARPWLALPSSAIDTYVRRHRLRWVEDTSNADRRFARNRLRLDVWPALDSAFPESEACLAVASAWAQEARECLDALARLDLATLRTDAGLSLAAWSRLEPARRSNALRAWLAEQGIPVTAALVRRLAEEAGRPGVARWPLGEGELRRHRGRLRYQPSRGTATGRGAPAAGPGIPGETVVRMAGAGRYAVPGWPGHFEVREVPSGGVAASRLEDAIVAARSGAERMQLGPGRPARSLKKQYQALGLAPWDREGPVLRDRDGALIFVAGLGVDARALAAPGERQFSVQWVASPQGRRDDVRG
jgi:tRNA(Ile)-lysidine synthase